LCDELVRARRYNELLYLAPVFLSLNDRDNIGHKERMMNSLATPTYEAIGYYFNCNFKETFVKLKAIEEAISSNIFKYQYNIMLSGMLAYCYHCRGDDKSACDVLSKILASLKGVTPYDKDKYNGFYNLYLKNYNNAVAYFARHIGESGEINRDCQINIGIAIHDMMIDNILHSDILRKYLFVKPLENYYDVF